METGAVDSARDNDKDGDRDTRPAPRLFVRRVISSAGRAPRLHRGGRQFESVITHFACQTPRGWAKSLPLPGAAGRSGRGTHRDRISDKFRAMPGAAASSGRGTHRDLFFPLRIRPGGAAVSGRGTYRDGPTEGQSTRSGAAVSGRGTYRNGPTEGQSTRSGAAGSGRGTHRDQNSVPSLCPCGVTGSGRGTYRDDECPGNAHPLGAASSGRGTHRDLFFPLRIRPGGAAVSGRGTYRDQNSVPSLCPCGVTGSGRGTYRDDECPGNAHPLGAASSGRGTHRDRISDKFRAMPGAADFGRGTHRDWRGEGGGVYRAARSGQEVRRDIYRYIYRGTLERPTEKQHNIASPQTLFRTYFQVSFWVFLLAWTLFGWVGGGPGGGSLVFWGVKTSQAQSLSQAPASSSAPSLSLPPPGAQASQFSTLPPQVQANYLRALARSQIERNRLETLELLSEERWPASASARPTIHLYTDDHARDPWWASFLNGAYGAAAQFDVDLRVWATPRGTPEANLFSGAALQHALTASEAGQIPGQTTERLPEGLIVATARETVARALLERASFFTVNLVPHHMRHRAYDARSHLFAPSLRSLIAGLLPLLEARLGSRQRRQAAGVEATVWFLVPDAAYGSWSAIGEILAENLAVTVHYLVLPRHRTTTAAAAAAELRLKQSLLQRYSGVSQPDFVLTWHAAALDAVLALSKEGLVTAPIGAIDLSLEGRDALRRGDVLFALDRAPFLQGWYSVLQLALVMRGEQQRLVPIYPYTGVVTRPSRAYWQYLGTTR